MDVMDLIVLDKEGAVVKKLTSQGKNAILNWKYGPSEKSTGRKQDAVFFS
jgi:hypothetical protein